MRAEVGGGPERLSAADEEREECGHTEIEDGDRADQERARVEAASEVAKAALHQEMALTREGGEFPPRPAQQPDADHQPDDAGDERDAVDGRHIHRRAIPYLARCGDAMGRSIAARRRAGYAVRLSVQGRTQPCRWHGPPSRTRRTTRDPGDRW